MYINAVHAQGSIIMRQLRFEYFMCAKILFMRFVYVPFEKNKLKKTLSRTEVYSLKNKGKVILK